MIDLTSLFRSKKRHRSKYIEVLDIRCGDMILIST
jgi:hypothetical protein